MKWLPRVYTQYRKRTVKTVRKLAYSPLFIAVALCFISIACGVLVWAGVQSLVLSADFSADANKYQAYAIEMDIESLDLTNSANIVDNQNFYAFSDPNFLKNLAANDPTFNKVFSDINNNATSDLKDSASFRKSSDFMQKAADTATSESSHEQSVGLITVTFGSVVLGGLFSWLLSLYIESFKKPKKRAKRSRTSTQRS